MLDTRRDFPHVLQLGAELAGVTIEDNGQRRTHATHRAAREQRETEQRARQAQHEAKRLQAIEQQAEVFSAFFAGLELEGDAVSYLAHRGFDHHRKLFEPAYAFGVRSVGDETSELVAHLAQRFGEATLCKLGLTDNNGSHRFEHHRLLLPVIASSRVVWFQARSTDLDCPKARRWNGPRGVVSGLFNAAALEQNSQADVLLCEGPTDTLAASVWQAELEASWGSPLVTVGKAGTGALKREQAQLLAGRTVYVAYDGDSAGETGAKAAAHSLYVAGAREVKRLPMGECEDVAAWVESLKADWIEAS